MGMTCSAIHATLAELAARVRWHSILDTDVALSKLLAEGSPLAPPAVSTHARMNRLQLLTGMWPTERKRLKSEREGRGGS